MNYTSIKNGNLKKNLKDLNAYFKLNKNDYEGILKDIEDLNNLINDKNSSKVKVVCAGIYNAGKSTFLNQIVGKSVFEVGDIPTTTKMQQYENNNVLFIDTPGVNANENDNNTALQIYKDADLVLFVSNIQNGGLNASEGNYLKEIETILGGEEIFKNNVLFMLSNKHQVDEIAIPKIVEEHKNNINKVMGYIPENIFVFDSCTYENGCKNKENTLINESGFLDIKKVIDNKVDEFANSVEKNRENKIESKAKILDENLKKLLTPVNDMIYKLDKDEVKNKTNIKNINELENELKNKINQFGKNLNESKSKPHARVRIVYSKSGLNEKHLSESAAKKVGQKTIEKAFDKRGRAAREAVDEIIQDIVKYIEISMHEENYYYKNTTEATKLILDYSNLLMKNGINIKKELLEEINIVPNMEGMDENTIRRQLNEDLIENSSYSSLSWYITQNLEIDEIETYVPGIFGDRWATRYHIDSYSVFEAVSEIESDIQGVLDSNVNFIWNKVEKIVDDFNKKLIKILNDRVLLLSKETKDQIQKLSNLNPYDLVKIKKLVKEINLN